MKDLLRRLSPITVLLVGLAFVLSVAPVAAGPSPGQVGSGTLRQHGPDWSTLFGSDGWLLDSHAGPGNGLAKGRPATLERLGGIDALVIQDSIAAGTAIDMSALVEADELGDRVIYNGPVSPDHDLGHSFLLATLEHGNLVLYVRVERLAPSPEQGESHVDIELVQDRVRLLGGSPWHLVGGRSTDDLRVRMNLLAGELVSVELLRYTEDSSYERIAFSSSQSIGGGCATDDPRFWACGGVLPEAERGLIGTGDPIEPPTGDGFLDLRVDIGALLGMNPDYTRILVSTPEDIALGTFRAFGGWSDGRRVNDYLSVDTSGSQAAYSPPDASLERGNFR